MLTYRHGKVVVHFRFFGYIIDIHRVRERKANIVALEYGKD
jgi:hypothetical protein